MLDLKVFEMQMITSQPRLTCSDGTPQQTLLVIFMHRKIEEALLLNSKVKLN